MEKNTINDSLKWRYATQTFNTEKEIPEQDLHTILESGNLAATAFGLQPFGFIAVTDQAVKDSLVEHAYGQEHIAQLAGYLINGSNPDWNDTVMSLVGLVIKEIENYFQ